MPGSCSNTVMPLSMLGVAEAVDFGVVNRPQFEVQTRAEPDICFWQMHRMSQNMRNCGVSKRVVYGIVAGIITPKIATTLAKTLD